MIRSSFSLLSFSFYLSCAWIRGMVNSHRRCLLSIIPEFGRDVSVDLKYP